MRSTRQRILQIIQRSRTETVAGLARELGLAATTVRRHLDILQRDGMVQFGEVRKKSGRPEYAFSLTERGHESMPKGYDALLSGILREFAGLESRQIAGKSGAEALDAALRRLGRSMALRYLNADAGSRSAAAARALREMEFEPQVEDGPAGTRISLSNCPFRSVALSDDAVCSYDSAMLEAILGRPVTRERCISRGHDCCEYFAEAVTRPVDKSGNNIPAAADTLPAPATGGVDAGG
ncbi:MAG: winged helix-turn-helix transcriptional regulator [Chloroflexi bacterium]|nr:winged helix-turn-helix transcriptional regulator [Chloroflexota bacterium]